MNPLPLALFLFVGCSSSSPSLKEAEALLGQTKFEEAAQKFEFVCAEAPASPECPPSRARAAKALLEAGKKALEAGEATKAERTFLYALANADDETAKEIETRLGDDDLKQGLRFESAAADTNKARAFAVVATIAAGNSPSAAKAKAWIEKEQPGQLVAQVLAACGPNHEGSCIDTFEKLSALASKPPGFDEAKAAHDAEQKRTEKTRAELERFISVFVQRGKREQAFQECLIAKAAEIEAEYQRYGACLGDVYTDNQSPYERFDSQQTEDSLFRKRNATLGDPTLMQLYEARRTGAITTGNDPKPADAKKAGGAK